MVTNANGGLETALVNVTTGELVAFDADARVIGDLYRKSKSSIVDCVKYAIECGRALIAKKGSMRHGKWLPWLQVHAAELGFETRRTAARLMSLAASNGSLTSHLEPPEALALSRQIWGNLLPANYSSDTNEWYTPEPYIDSVRAVLGCIDLDPASCEKANETVQAAEYFTETDDGLSRDWHGRVFLNPPYGTADGGSRAGLFCRKAIAEYEAGRVSEAIILVNSVHSQTWQKPLYAFPVCLVNHRIEFVDAQGRVNPNPTFANVFVYLGQHVRRFAEEFKQHGYCMEPL
jgi:ParB family chromosome partitioning protein